MVPAVWLRVIGHPAEGAGAWLAHYAARCLRNVCYPGLLPKPGARTRGVLYRGLGERDIHRLERYEGPLYERRRLTVTLETGGKARAWCFVIRKAHRRRLSPQPWSAEHFVAAHLAGYLKTL